MGVGVMLQLVALGNSEFEPHSMYIYISESESVHTHIHEKATAVTVTNARPMPSPLLSGQFVDTLGQITGVFGLGILLLSRLLRIEKWRKLFMREG